MGDFSDVDTVDDLHDVIRKYKDQWKLFSDAVLPGLKARVAEVKREQRTRMDLRKQMEPLLPGDVVWIVEITRSSKWKPVYEGPFTILCQHKGGTYSLMDTMGELLPRKVPISQIKLSSAGFSGISSEKGGKDEEMISKEHYVIEKILDHKLENGEYKYLVQWKDYGPEFNSWEPVECFDGLEMISRYWKFRNKNTKKIKTKNKTEVVEEQVLKRSMRIKKKSDRFNI